ncbi:MAG TPA: molybdenum cofactor biosynthesis protein MoaE [Candidatus Angelobacter sp.]|nr:molybdenum cofactor biosynthesis protein MoaE [Candidatus Angelobacter sp.]
MKSRISGKPINPAKALKSVMDEEAGGTVLFIGTIRSQTDGKKVKGLEYEVYRKMAKREIPKLEGEIRKRWPIKSIRIIHREGKLKVGEVSVVVAVSAEHRGDAFDAARYAIDRIKESFPIWKREKFSGGRKVWAKGIRIQSIPAPSQPVGESNASPQETGPQHRRSLVEA